MKLNKKPLIMGILNVTPDSFSDGGKYNTASKALKRALEMEKEGADIIDIGGESTGPNSKNVTIKEELRRVIPVIKLIRKYCKLPISIDTYKAEVADQALKSGANIINDVTGLRGDKNLAKIANKYKCPIIIMYSKDNSPRTTIKNKHYKNVMEDIKKFLTKQIKYAKLNGIKKKNIIIDPGMGNFISKIPKYSFEIIAKLYELKKIDHPILIGMSHKSFLGASIEQREQKALALSAIAYLNGASIIRTHDVKNTRLCLQWT